MLRKFRKFLRGRVSRVMAKNGDVSVPLLTDDPGSNTSNSADTEAASTVEYTYSRWRFFCTVAFRLAMRFWGFLATFFLILLLTWWRYGGIWAFLLLVLAIMGVAYNVQDMLLYYPNQPNTSRFYVESPASIGLPFESIFLRTRDGLKIHAYFLPQPAPLMSSAVTVIYFHGNAGNIGHRLLNAQGFYVAMKCNILLVEYRGYGKSEGKPSEGGLYIDARSAFEYLLERNDIDRRKIILFGRSLGGAVAAQLASQPWCSKVALGLILENTFTSLPDIGRYIFDLRALHLVPDWVHKNKFPTKSRVQRIVLPTLFLSGLADSLIPPSMMQQLYDISGSALKRLARFDAGTHNETWLCQGYYETINRFIHEVLESRASDVNRRTSATGATYSVDVPFDDGGAFHSEH